MLRHWCLALVSLGHEWDSKKSPFPTSWLHISDIAQIKWNSQTVDWIISSFAFALWRRHCFCRFLKETYGNGDSRSDLEFMRPESKFWDLFLIKSQPQVLEGSLELGHETPECWSHFLYFYYFWLNICWRVRLSFSRHFDTHCTVHSSKCNKIATTNQWLFMQHEKNVTVIHTVRLN